MTGPLPSPPSPRGSPDGPASPSLCCGRPAPACLVARLGALCRDMGRRGSPVLVPGLAGGPQSKAGRRPADTEGSAAGQGQGTPRGLWAPHEEGPLPRPDLGSSPSPLPGQPGSRRGVPPSRVPFQARPMLPAAAPAGPGSPAGSGEPQDRRGCEGAVVPRMSPLPGIPPEQRAAPLAARPGSAARQAGEGRSRGRCAGPGGRCPRRCPPVRAVGRERGRAGRAGPGREERARVGVRGCD